MYLDDFRSKNVHLLQLISLPAGNDDEPSEVKLIVGPRKDGIVCILCLQISIPQL